jgi:hypothetical protein
MKNNPPDKTRGVVVSVAPRFAGGYLFVKKLKYANLQQHCKFEYFITE